LSFTGTLANPNEVVLIPIQLSANAGLLIQSWAFGGTAAAPGGVNAAGDVIAAGGIDSYLSLFNGQGGSATFLASNDDGPCPPASPAPSCLDAQLSVAALPAGLYTIALTQPGNLSFAENRGAGTLGDGFIGLETDFRGRTGAWAIDVQSSALVVVPEPETITVLLLGLTLIAAGRRCRVMFKKGEPR
jgi:hypothetical protein